MAKVKMEIPQADISGGHENNESVGILVSMITTTMMLEVAVAVAVAMVNEVPSRQGGEVQQALLRRIKLTIGSKVTDSKGSLEQILSMCDNKLIDLVLNSMLGTKKTV